MAFPPSPSPRNITSRPQPKLKALISSLLSSLQDGVIGGLASDHSPSPCADKLLDEGNFLKAWGGISGITIVDYFGIHLFNHSLPPSFLPYFIQSLAPLLTHSLAPSLTRSLLCSLTQSLAHSLAHPLSRSLAHLLTLLFTHSLTHSLVCSFICKFCKFPWFQVLIANSHH